MVSASYFQVAWKKRKVYIYVCIKKDKCNKMLTILKIFFILKVYWDDNGQ